MAYTNINKPSDYFNTILYTGNSATSSAGTLARSLTGVGFQPDFSWVKGRTTGNYDSHGLHDVVRTAPMHLRTDGTDAELNVTTAYGQGGIGAFNSDGVDLYSGASGGTTNWNTSGTNYVIWNWLADNTSGSSNTDGSITSTVSANTTSGFSIVTYTGNGTGGATIGHGLGTAPACVIVKNRTSGTYDWLVYHKGLGATKYMALNQTDASTTSAIGWNNTEPSSSVVTLGTANAVNTNSSNYVAYCFAEKKGFSKFGSYTGNGSNDGTFIYTGFKPAWFLTKQTNGIGQWVLQDTSRSPINPANLQLYPNLNNTDSAEGSGATWDFVSNGIKIRNSAANYNASGGTYIYMAFAEFPTVSSTGTPCTAR